MSEQKQFDYLKNIYELLTDVNFDLNTLPDDLAFNPDFLSIAEEVMSIRKLADSLARGDLKLNVRSTGYITSSLKALQASLLHVTRQVKLVAQGDLSQRTEYLGDFSEAFNTMVEQLNITRTELEYRADTDVLTGIPNRRRSYDFGYREFAHFKRHAQPMGLLIVDLDFLKETNDSYGHHWGDIVLISAAKCIQQSIRMSDMVGRLGGDEFIVVLSHSSEEISYMVTNRIKDQIQSMKLNMSDGKMLDLTASFGLTNALPEDNTFEDTVRRADKALYCAKELGRNHLIVI